MLDALKTELNRLLRKTSELTEAVQADAPSTASDLEQLAIEALYDLYEEGAYELIQQQKKGVIHGTLCLVPPTKRQKDILLSFAEVAAMLKAQPASDATPEGK